MRRIIKSMICAVAVMIAMVSCEKEKFSENTLVSGEKIEVSIAGSIGEFVPVDDTKATAESVVRVTWTKDDEVYVYDGSEYLGTLTVSPDENSASYALLTGTIKASSLETAPEKLTLVYSNTATVAPTITEGKVSIDLSAQSAAEVPFVLYATIDYDTATLDKSDEYVPFSFATSVMTLNVTNLPTTTENAKIAITKAEIDEMSTACELTISSNAEPTVAGTKKGVITRSAGFSQSDSRGVFTIAVAAEASAPSERKILVYQGSKVSGAPFATTTTLASNKSYNTVCQLSEYVNNAPDDMLPGEFTVSADGKKVHFSQGNLQATYNSSTGKYSFGFAEKQYDIIGGKDNKDIGENTGNNTIDNQTDGAVVDLFGWSTASTTYGINISTSDEDYNGDFVDWGTAIDGNGTWRTLSGDENGEWKYLFEKRNAATVCGTENARYAVASVNNICGILLLPDTYVHPSGVTDLKNINNDKASYTDNEYDVTAWGAMESAGAVFLPAAGYRTQNDINKGNNGYEIYYWSSSADDGESSYRITYRNEKLSTDSFESRSYGHSVRLVTESAGYTIAVKVTGVSLASGKDTVEVGASKALVATISPSNATHQEIIWSSSDETVAMVDENGKVKGVAAGSAIITATTVDGNFTAVCLVTVTPKNLPAGALPGVFSVSATKKIHFSQGNLTYDVNASTDKWKFYEHQYDCATGYDANLISLFTWGYDATKSIVPDGIDYVTGHTANGEIFSKSEDWGYVFGGESSVWRTLTKDEWCYLFAWTAESGANTDTSSPRHNLHKYGVTVCGKTNCVVLLPDNWVWDASTVGTGWQTGGYPETATDGFPVAWQKMQEAGAVCLPAAGGRYKANVDGVGSSGYYWSSSANNSYAYLVYLPSNNVKPDHNVSRYYGYSVRLITESK